PRHLSASAIGIHQLLDLIRRPSLLLSHAAISAAFVSSINRVCSYAYGLLQNGTFLFATYSATTTDTYVVDFNAATGKVTSQPSRINSSNAGKSMYPLWFDGGRMISYYAVPPTKVVTKRFPDGPERSFPIGLQAAGGNTWMSDGTAVFPGFRAGVGEGLFRVNLQTSKIEPILLRTAGAGGFGGFRGGFPTISADGNIVFYRDDRRHAITARNLKESTERVVYEEKGPPYGNIRSVHRSPDEKWIAFIVNHLRSNTLMIVPASGGSARELCTARWPDEIHAAQSFSWMPDSKRILFVRRNGERSELWNVSIDKPRPQRTGFAHAGMRHLAVHPDGGSLAYAAGEQGQMSIQSVELK
ncbi:MAG: PD40 domain-containing protein, partial [Acidobacteriia bacterium]|nr:PD40 domain-containing protein [Terriglobia bacterium]